LQQVRRAETSTKACVQKHVREIERSLSASFFTTIPRSSLPRISALHSTYLSRSLLSSS
jgi:hypothetical protein